MITGENVMQQTYTIKDDLERFSTYHYMMLRHMMIIWQNDRLEYDIIDAFPNSRCGVNSLGQLCLWQCFISFCPRNQDDSNLFDRKIYFRHCIFFICLLILIANLVATLLPKYWNTEKTLSPPKILKCWEKTLSSQNIGREKVVWMTWVITSQISKPCLLYQRKEKIN